MPLTRVRYGSSVVALVAALAGAVIALVTSQPAQPPLTRVINATPIGENSAIYEVLSDPGGATVGFTYLYYLAPKQPDDASALRTLEDLAPFLVTRQSGAISGVSGLQIDAKVEDTLYQFHNRSLLRENGKTLPVSINLDATTGAGPL